MRCDAGMGSGGRATVGAAEDGPRSASEPPQNRQKSAVDSDVPWQRGQTREASEAATVAPRSTTRAG